MAGAIFGALQSVTFHGRRNIDEVAVNLHIRFSFFFSAEPNEAVNLNPILAEEW